VFTRPAVPAGSVLMTGADHFDGYQIVRYYGMVWGISIRSRDMGQDCLMGCKTMTGGELTSYTELSDESRQKALDRMLDAAKRLRCNGIINVRFELRTMGHQGANAEVVAFGTAVIIEPIADYVPVGAVGNILAEIADRLTPR
jgi:uncharacterized protein YbjQ (UPF0145 family)